MIIKVRTSKGRLPVGIHWGEGEGARVKGKDDILLQIFENDIIADNTDVINYLWHERLYITRRGRHFLPVKETEFMMILGHTLSY